jgi:hypothetical protein
MRFSVSISHAAVFLGGHRSRCWFSIVLLIATWAAKPLRAQDASQKLPENSAPYMLHLYARLVELPTIILLRDGQDSTTLDPQQINIRLNSHQPFHPTSIRREDNDPLSLAFLIDVSGDQRDQLAAFQKHFAEWVSKSLHPQDHVSVYALDCKLIQTSNDVPANSSLLPDGLDLALTTTLTHGTSKKSSCGNSIPLRDSIRFVIDKLSELPTRRTLILFAGDHDGKSNTTWPQLNAEATDKSVTVFALATPGPMELQPNMDISDLVLASGGVLFSPTPVEVRKALDQIISLLRNRYILQFPLPPSLVPVVYHVNVTVPKFDAVIRTSAISVPTPNPAVDHPSTDLPSQAPVSNPPPTTPPASDQNPQ